MRITNKDLEGVVKRLNRITNNPEASYVRTEDGKLVAQIGNYHIDSAYGGVSLAQMQTEGGGIRRVIDSGYTTKKDLFNQIHAYINGLMDCENK